MKERIGIQGVATFALVLTFAALAGCARPVTAGDVEKRFVETYASNQACLTIGDCGELVRESVNVSKGNRKGTWTVTWRTQSMDMFAAEAHRGVVSAQWDDKGTLLLQVIGK